MEAGSSGLGKGLDLKGRGQMEAIESNPIPNLFHKAVPRIVPTQKSEKKKLRSSPYTLNINITLERVV